MRPKGTIYSKKRFKQHGDLILTLPALIRLFYHLVRLLGVVILSFVLILMILSFGPLIKEELEYKLGKNTLKDSNSLPVSVDADEERRAKIQKEALSYGVSSYFSIVVPKIGAVSNIIANVDTANEKEYLDALKKGVAHAKGSYFPGQGADIFLFSHSTNSPLNFARFNAIFYLLNKLESGDEIIIFFADNKYEYKVVEKLIAKPSDTSWLQTGSNQERLILMTCDPPGTNWNRLLVFAKPV